MALSDESSQESPGFPTKDLQKAALQPPVAEAAVHESGVEDEQLAEGLPCKPIAGVSEAQHTPAAP